MNFLLFGFVLGAPHIADITPLSDHLGGARAYQRLLLFDCMKVIFIVMNVSE